MEYAERWIADLPWRTAAQVRQLASSLHVHAFQQMHAPAPTANVLAKRSIDSLSTTEDGHAAVVDLVAVMLLAKADVCRDKRRGIVC